MTATEPLPLNRLPGDAMSLSDALVEENALAELLGIPADDIHQPRWGGEAVPYWPEEPAAAFEDGGRRWQGLDPNACWHPLVWLSPHIAHRYRDEDTGEIIETNDEWALRVWLELVARGLLDVTTGEWVDILDLAGVDIEQSATIDRLERWLDGEPDDLFDTLTVETVAAYRPDDPDTLEADWARRRSIQWLPDLYDRLTQADVDDARQVFRTARHALDEHLVDDNPDHLADLEAAMLAVAMDLSEVATQLAQTVGTEWESYRDEWADELTQLAEQFSTDSTPESFDAFRAAVTTVCAEASQLLDS